MQALGFVLTGLGTTAVSLLRREMRFERGPLRSTSLALPTARQRYILQRPTRIQMY